MLIACSGSDKVSVFEELLSKIPDTEGNRQYIIVNDYATAREMFGISLPGQDAGEDELAEYFNALLYSSGAGLTTGPFISGLNPQSLPLDHMKFLAFDARNVDQTVSAGIPPRELEIVRGRFDPNATGRALASCSECPPPDLEKHLDLEFYSWGEDLAIKIISRFSPPAFDSLGRGGRIAVQEGYVFRTVETPGMKAVIQVQKGLRDSLGDVAEFQLVAGGLSELGAFGAFISNQSHSTETLRQALSQRDFEVIRPELEKFPMLRPYQVFATGIGKDETGRYMALVLVHHDADSATENIEQLKKRID